MLVFLLFIVAFESRLQLPSWMFVVGRMHPAFLHFPIVLLLLFFFALWLPKRGDDNWIEALGLTAALAAVITAIMGLFLSLEEVREGSSFTLHKWGGISIAVFAAGFYWLHQRVRKSHLVTRPLTLLAAMTVFLVGHWGGNLTHGENYLFAPLAGEIEKAPFDEAYAFQDVVLPVLENKCGSCHSSANKKGNLSLVDTTGLLEGGKTGPLFIPGSPDSSLLMWRILLPLEEKKHMAPRSKPQLTEDEIQLLRTWIKGGAPLHKKVIDLPSTDSFRLAAATYLSPSENNAVAYGFPPADKATIQALNNNYRVVTPLGKSSPALSVSFYGKAGYSSKALEELLQVKEQIIQLNLASLPVTDADLKFVQQLQNLEKLNLSNTDITDKGIGQLAGLQKLKELALSGTAVTVASFQKLVMLPNLAFVFAWNTKLDSADVAALQKRNKNIRFQMGYNGAKDTTTYTLNPPTIKTAEGVFAGSILVEIKHGVRGVDIRYTLDGTPPDSIKSAVYNGLIALDSSAKVKVKAFKDGWHSSGVAERQFFRKGMQFDSVLLLSKPDSSFDAGNPAILQDDHIGNGAASMKKKSFGFKDNAGVFLLSFHQTRPVREVCLITVENVGSGFFPPQSIEVWGGVDKNKMKLLAKKKMTPPKGYDPPSIQGTKLDFTSVDVKYLKVVVQNFKKMPQFHFNKGKPSVVLISEIIAH